MERVQLLSRYLRGIKQLYNKTLRRELASHGLDVHFEALLALSEQEKRVTQNMLAELLQTDKSRIVSIVYDLKKKHLILIKTNPADRREHYISLSAKARAAVPIIEEVIKKVNSMVNAGIGDEKLQAFFEVSCMMRRNLLKNGDMENTQAATPSH